MPIYAILLGFWRHRWFRWALYLSLVIFVGKVLRDTGVLQ